MGGSTWSTDHYYDRTAYKSSTGTPTFTYDADVRSGKAKAATHDKLNIKGKIRESRDSAAHPESTAIGVVFDVTGSMSVVPRIMQEKLPKLMTMLLQKGYIKDPQILFGAVGDATCDRAPLQIGQFESGIEMDDDVTNIYLESGGGGQNTESYELAMYYFAHRTSIDCFEKRNKKGYLFIIGDEHPYKAASKNYLESVIGVNVQDDVPLEEVVKAVKEKYNVFFFIPSGTSYFHDPALFEHWAKLLGKEFVIKLQDPEAVCESIALCIGLLEGTLDADSITDDLKDVGASNSVIATVSTGLDALAKSASALAKVGTGSLPEKTGRSTSTERL